MKISIGYTLDFNVTETKLVRWWWLRVIINGVLIRDMRLYDSLPVILWHCLTEW